MPRSYPAEFRRKVLDLVAEGRPVAEVAQQLGVSGQTIYNWRNQDLVDRGLRSGVATSESVELGSARRRIRNLAPEIQQSHSARRASDGGARTGWPGAGPADSANPEADHSASGGLLTDLLTDNPTRSVTHKHPIALRERKHPVQRHLPAPTDIA